LSFVIVLFYQNAEVTVDYNYSELDYIFACRNSHRPVRYAVNAHVYVRNLVNLQSIVSLLLYPCTIKCVLTVAEIVVMQFVSYLLSFFLKLWALHNCLQRRTTDSVWLAVQEFLYSINIVALAYESVMHTVAGAPIVLPLAVRGMVHTQRRN